MKNILLIGDCPLFPETKGIINKDGNQFQWQSDDAYDHVGCLLCRFFVQNPRSESSVFCSGWTAVIPPVVLKAYVLRSTLCDKRDLRLCSRMSRRILRFEFLCKLRICRCPFFGLCPVLFLFCSPVSPALF